MSADLSDDLWILELRMKEAEERQQAEIATAVLRERERVLRVVEDLERSYDHPEAVNALRVAVVRLREGT